MSKRLLARSHRLWILGCAAALTALPALAESRYSYPRVLEGPATLIAAGGGAERVDLHQPILVGDRARVPHGSRLELVLADRSLLRLGGDSEVDFERIAYSAETEDRSTTIRLHRAKAQLIVPEDTLGDTLPRIETPGATIYVHRAGSFRITVGHGGWTELVVRDGLAEMVTDRGSLLVHAGEQGSMRDGYGRRLELRLAGARDSLERWGDWLSAEAARADVPYVDQSIRYAARPLAEHGTWVVIEHRRAWRPTVVVDWRPYVHGYWRHTPIGLTWVSHDPWGYVTHHYGSWDLVPGHGWVWYPGAVYAPARVHWYWGPTYVGWCPSGYYRNHYARHRHRLGLSVGLYGWAGGSWHPFRHWSFTLHANFGHRRQHRHVHRGAHFARHHAGPRLERGIITTEPRVGRGRHRQAFADLRREAERRERLNGRPLPDVSDFIARKPLPRDLERAVLKPAPAAPSRPSAPARVENGGRPRPGRDAVALRGDRQRPVHKPAPRIDAPRVERGRPGVRSTPGRRVDPLRADRTRPAVRPGPRARVDAPRVERQRPALKPGPRARVETPRVERRRPALKPGPRARVETPRVERQRPALKPGPRARVETPGIERRRPALRPGPRARVETPRVERRRPALKPGPRARVETPGVERQRPALRPGPRARVERQKPAVRPRTAPRVDSPRTPRPKPTVRAKPAPRPDRAVDRNRSQRRDPPRAQAPKRPQPEKPARSRDRDSRSRQRDN